MCSYNLIDAKYLKTPQEQERLERGMDAIYNQIDKKVKKIRKRGKQCQGN